MTDFQIRPAKPTDAAQISSLISTTWSHFFGYSVSPSDLATYLSTTLSVNQISLDLANPSYNYTVIVPPHSSTIAGVIQLVYDSTEPCLEGRAPIELRRLYVAEEYHGKGIAQLLMEAADAVGREKGCDTIWLGVWENNPRAERFYQKCGYDKRGEHWFMVGESKRRDWVMEKKLDP
ncbi:diamine N-acetyltransferase, partial [Tremellales sp. Uapishka_1]